MPGSTLSLSRIEYDLDPTDNDAITANLVDDVTIVSLPCVENQPSRESARGLILGFSGG
jgi:hypothetical protein